MQHDYSLVSEVEFVQATRDTGYQSTATAVAELVDNSLQAGATRIWIRVDEEKSTAGRQITLSVFDNGHGMSADVLRRALQFGGTHRFNDRQGLGRFGMGLPNSSVSQCRRVELFSWRKPQQVLWTYLDIDEVVSRRLNAIPKPRTRTLPSWVKNTPDSGTLVIWKQCDRLDYRKASTIAGKLTKALGRKFRHFLEKGVAIEVNTNPVAPVDPLFLMTSAEMGGAEEPFPPLQYWVRADDAAIGESLVQVRFSLLPVTQWHSLPVDRKRHAGISGGAGVSIVRAGREIAYGWHFMGNKRRQNYDDWWRCEVSFDPALDDWFGVTHSKQGISPRQGLNAFLAPDMERIAHQLNARVQAAFAEVRGPKRPQSELNAEERDWLLPALVSRKAVPKNHDRLPQRSGLRYRVVIDSATDPHFFTWQLRSGTLYVRINENHPFYQAVYRPVADGGDAQIQFHLECLLLAFARSEAQRAKLDEPARYHALREDWSDILAALLG